jgi:hypothetical protein
VIFLMAMFCFLFCNKASAITVGAVGKITNRERLRYRASKEVELGKGHTRLHLLGGYPGSNCIAPASHMLSVLMSLLSEVLQLAVLLAVMSRSYLRQWMERPQRWRQKEEARGGGDCAWP